VLLPQGVTTDRQLFDDFITNHFVGDLWHAREKRHL
jgi:hypothetical protein